MSDSSAFIEDSLPPSPRPSPPPPISNPLKRKDRSDDEDADDDHPLEKKPLPPARPDEYEKGFITCESCSVEIPIRDDNDKFTTVHWDAHRMTHLPSGPTVRSNKPVIFAPETAVETMAHPPTKRRRAKRTEEERIEYLRSDPYVGQFEPYRVLCASCDKWIRLRPNSTYCSIPWDAHRKSCLAKKINNKNVYALEERNTLFSKDSDVRKFDPERLLCNICDKWLGLPPDDHLQAVQTWLQHRASCQKNAPGPSSQPITSPSQHVHPAETHRDASYSSDSASPIPKAAVPLQSPPSQSPHPRLPPITTVTGGSPSSFHALTPSTYAPAHESRRRSAEQRAANLRQDPYIAEVEPNRVFCKLCQKWVQLRQDSSYCAYPWTQHRSKCEARHFRRSQKAADIAELKARRQSYPSYALQEEDELLSEHEDGSLPPRPPRLRRRSENLESEDGADPRYDGHHFRKTDPRPRLDHRPYPPPTSSSRVSYSPRQSAAHGHHAHPYASQPTYYKSRSNGPYGHTSSNSRYAGGSMSQAISPPIYRHESRGSFSSSHISHPSYPPRTNASRRHSVDVNMDVDADGEPDVDDDEEGDYTEADAGRVSRTGAPPPRPPPFSPTMGIPSTSRGTGAMNRAISRRPWPASLADLDSHTGRKQFIFASVEYLFSTTYESTDDMSISALLAYLNAAMPQDKHEDFDTTEVIRAVVSMKEKGKIIFEGDILRLID
ncbi:hypothetical protein CPB83DRAFT_899717 [Crepidotus variabilis]|uniref:Uncharacterized protein n=1 Tax=Crepidotus variabilis TaxID=179855 RepID=A0A9P6JIH9_9AGAR|nr:hypothetical protein CPB83DRAFT_899717 [Crepidotus variabilis]